MATEVLLSSLVDQSLPESLEKSARRRRIQAYHNILSDADAPVSVEPVYDKMMNENMKLMEVDLAVSMKSQMSMSSRLERLESALEEKNKSDVFTDSAKIELEATLEAERMLRSKIQEERDSAMEISREITANLARSEEEVQQMRSRLASEQQERKKLDESVTELRLLKEKLYIELEESRKKVIEQGKKVGKKQLSESDSYTIDVLKGQLREALQENMANAEATQILEQALMERDRARAAAAEFQQQCSDLEIRLEKAASKVRQLKTDRSELTGQVESLHDSSDLHQKCALLEQQLVDVQTTSQRVVRLEKERAQVIMEGLRQQYEELETKYNAEPSTEEFENGMATLRSQLEEREAKVKSLESELKEVREATEKILESERARAYASVDKFKNDVFEDVVDDEESKKEIEALRSMLARANEDRQKHEQQTEKLQDELESKQKEIEAMRSLLRKTDISNVKQLEEDKKALEARIAELEAKQELPKETAPAPVSLSSTYSATAPVKEQPKPETPAPLTKGSSAMELRLGARRSCLIDEPPPPKKAKDPETPTSRDRADSVSSTGSAPGTTRPPKAPKSKSPADHQPMSTPIEPEPVIEQKPTQRPPPSQTPRPPLERSQSIGSDVSDLESPRTKKKGWKTAMRFLAGKRSKSKDDPLPERSQEAPEPHQTRKKPPPLQRASTFNGLPTLSTPPPPPPSTPPPPRPANMVAMASPLQNPLTAMMGGGLGPDGRPLPPASQMRGHTPGSPNSGRMNVYNMQGQPPMSPRTPPPRMQFQTTPRMASPLSTSTPASPRRQHSYPIPK